MMIAHIVAAAKNGVIGREGDLPWNIPEDMAWFKSRTKGRALIMGRKTFEAVGHPLPHRLNVVVTRQKDYKPNVPNTEKAPYHICSTIEEALELCKKHLEKYNNEIFIIGGGEIYKQSVPLVDTIYLTRIHQNYDGDAKYPDPDPKKFKMVECQDRTEPVPFSFMTFKKI
jgi:dihydrofolate reductase